MSDYILFVDKAGKKRKGFYTKCRICNTTFISRIDQIQTTCSFACARKLRSNRKEIACAYCGKMFSKPLSKLQKSKSKLYFCTRKHKDEAQKLGGIKEIQPDHYGTGQFQYRKLFEEQELFCRRCGYKEFSSVVDIHHIDKNRENNEKSNLIPLCSNCHRGLHHNHWKFEEWACSANGNTFGLQPKIQGSTPCLST